MSPARGLSPRLQTPSFPRRPWRCYYPVRFGLPPGLVPPHTQGSVAPMESYFLKPEGLNLSCHSKPSPPGPGSQNPGHPLADVLLNLADTWFARKGFRSIEPPKPLRKSPSPVPHSKYRPWLL